MQVSMKNQQKDWVELIQKWQLESVAILSLVGLSLSLSISNNPTLLSHYLNEPVSAHYTTHKLMNTHIKQTHADLNQSNKTNEWLSYLRQKAEFKSQQAITIAYTLQRAQL